LPQRGEKIGRKGAKRSRDAKKKKRGVLKRGEKRPRGKINSSSSSRRHLRRSD